MSQHEKISRIARFGMLASALGIVILICVFGAMAVYVLGGLSEFNVAEELGLTHISGDLNFGERAVGVAFWLLTDVIGLWFCCVSYMLFRGFRRGGVFTMNAALRLRRIGWLVFALAPLSMISEFSGTAALSTLHAMGQETDGSIQISLSLEDTHIFAMVIGLLIVAVGHVFVEAVRLSEENESFV